jgi:hypothetical protein
VYELAGLASEGKMFGSERMVDRAGREVPTWQFGDWDWDVFFLMQDAAPHDKIAERIGKHPDPFSARNFFEEPRAGGAQTNRNLHELANHLDCRKLAGSAFVGVLKPGEDYSGPVDNLFDCPWIRGHCRDAIGWVFEEAQASRQRTICCLGGPAFELVAEILAIGDAEKSRLGRERGSTAAIGRFRVSSLWHPSRWPPGGRQVAHAAWKRMATESGLRWLP